MSGLAGACRVVQRLPHLFKVGTLWRGERVFGVRWATPKECQGKSCSGKALFTRPKCVIERSQRIERPMLDRKGADGRLHW